MKNRSLRNLFLLCSRMITDIYYGAHYRMISCEFRDSTAKVHGYLSENVTITALKRLIYAIILNQYSVDILAMFSLNQQF